MGKNRVDHIKDEDFTIDEFDQRHTGLKSKATFSLSEIDRTFKRGLPVTEIYVEEGHNHRKKFDPEVLRELADSIAQNGLIEPIVLIHTPGDERVNYLLCAGERRFRAIRDILKLETISDAMVWDNRAYAKRKVIAIQENEQREDITLAEKVFGYAAAIAESYADLATQGEKIEAFSTESGIPKRTVRSAMIIADAANDSTYVRELVENEYVKDLATIESISKALVTADTPKRKAKVLDFIEHLKKNNLIGNIREQAAKLSKYAKDGGTAPKIQTKDGASKNNAGEPSSKPKHATPTKVLKVSASQLNNFHDKIVTMENQPDAEWIESAKNVIKALSNSIEKFGTASEKEPTEAE